MAVKQNTNALPCSDESIQKATGLNWKKWFATLEKKGARELAHKELAQMINELHSAGGWWSQAIAVGYERLSGKRKLYGKPDGTFSASVSKTFSAAPAVVHEAIANERKRMKWAPGRLALRNATANKVVRLDAKEGVRVTAYLQAKPDGKTAVALEIAKLPKFESVAVAKQTWRVALEKLGKALQ